MEGIKINLFGIYGLLGLMLLSGAWIFEHSAKAGGLTITTAIILTIIYAISEQILKHRELSIKEICGWFERR